MIEFVPCEVDRLPFPALQYLQKAIDRTPGQDSALWDVLKTGGQVYLITDGEIIGATYIEFYPQILNIVLLGGKISRYRDDIYHFYTRLMKARDLKTIMILGRSGWGKMFPELKTIGTLFTLSG